MMFQIFIDVLKHGFQHNTITAFYITYCKPTGPQGSNIINTNVNKSDRKNDVGSVH